MLNKPTNLLPNSHDVRKTTFDVVNACGERIANAFARPSNGGLKSEVQQHSL